MAHPRHRGFTMIRFLKNNVMQCNNYRSNGIVAISEGREGGLDPSWLILFFGGAPVIHPQAPKPFQMSILGPLD